jgi:glucose/arabinose dehydrogenase
MRQHACTAVIALLVATGMGACSSSSDGGGSPTPPDTTTPPPNGTLALALQPVASGLAFPLYLTAPAGDPRLFIVEKGGTIRVVKDGTVLPTPFLDISSLVSKGGEQGLLGLAFDPQYAANRRFFVDYTDTDGNTVVASYSANLSNPDVADPGSAAVRLRVVQPFANHNGGHLAFGPDGYLYVALGDGGSAGDPDGRGQDPRDLLGSLLRIDVSGATGYTSPADNPRAENASWAPEVWSIGLRNPWRFSFDRATGDLYIGDVGQGAREEIDVSPAASGGGRGLNYGWAVTEGTACYRASTCDRTGLTGPVLDYTHADGSCSVTGGFVYRGSAIPQLAGTYFYGDFCAGWVRSFRFENGQAASPAEWPSLGGGSITSFGEDAAGELYVVAAGGDVSRIVAR